MADLQALYGDLVSSAVSATDPEPEPVRQIGTFQERLVGCLEPYKVKEFEKAFAKGNVLHELMLADDETAGQAFFPARRSAESEFSQPTALRGNGYDNDVYLCTDRGLLGTLSNILGLRFS
jgi:hypothetical protein